MLISENLKEEISKRRGFNFGFVKFANRNNPVHAVRFTGDNRVKKSDMHFHDFAQIWYCYGGSYTHIVDGRTYHCTKGSLFVIPPGVYHDVHYVEEYVDVLSIDIHWDMLLHSAPEAWIDGVVNLYWPAFSEEIAHTFSYCTVLSEHSRKIAEECLDWFDLLKFAPAGTVEKAEIYQKAETLFSLPELAVGKDCCKKAVQIAQTQLLPVMRIVSYLNQHYHEKLKAEDILPVAGISRRGMYRYFERIVGVPFSYYLQALRIKHVYIYLRTSTYSLAYISDACGFCDVRYMSRVFKAFLGESPQSRRKRLEEYYRRKRI